MLIAEWFPAYPASANSLGDYLIIACAVLVILGTRGRLSYDKLHVANSSAMHPQQAAAEPNLMQ